MRFLVLRGALLLFVLRAVAGACVGRWTGQARMPPRERLHEGVGFLRRREGAGNPGMMAVWGNCFIRAAALCPAKRRFAFSPMGRHARLAAEIPDIFIPLARNENSGMTTVFFLWGLLRCRESVLTTGVVIRRRAVSGETARGGFGLGDCFTRSWSGSTRGVLDLRFWGALLGLFWRLPGGEVESCSWQPEIGMEHASRGRRSGNKGVGARWRGRFRIFSARHCSRTKVSHAENSGMTMLFCFFSFTPAGGIAPVSGCVDHGSGHSAPFRLRRDGTRRLVFLFGGCSGVGGECVHTHGSGQPRMPPRERRHEGLGGIGGIGGLFHAP